MFRSGDFPSLQSMRPISLDEMSGVSLLNRTDTKFVTSASVLQNLLHDAEARGYRVSEINGQRLQPYESVYYDTPDLRMFMDHRNGKLVRKKVRVRTYLVSGRTFLEIKSKNNHRRTKKKRMEIPAEGIKELANIHAASEFLSRKTPWTLNDLYPETTTDFDRITLVDSGLTERVTIDMNLRFANFRSGIKADLGSLVVIEIKQDATKSSLFREILQRHRVLPFRISKYCVAVTLTDPSARYGRFKEKIRYIEKILDRKLI